MKVAINGFGRIGRAFLRAVLQNKKAKESIKIEAINVGPKKSSPIDLLFKYDSVMPEFAGNVEIKNDFLHVDGQKIKLFFEPDPTNLPWKKLGIDWVIESSGKFTTRELATKHLTAGAKKVLITAPSADSDVSIVPGVNYESYNPKKHSIISLGSCTTNAFAPLIKVISENFGITSGMMTTIHAYTNDQVLLDVEHKDPRRARAAAINIVPTKTGASKVVTQIFPELKGKIEAIAIRVPVPVVSLIDFAFVSEKALSVEKINKAFEKAANGKLKSILQYTDLPLVSSDFIGNTHSSIFDSLLTQQTGNIGKVFAWYDNEFGYSCRLKDFLLHNLIKIV